MSRPGFSITEIDVDKYSNWELNQKIRYEVLDIRSASDLKGYVFLIADSNGEFVEIREEHCKLGELQLEPSINASVFERV